MQAFDCVQCLTPDTRAERAERETLVVDFAEISRVLIAGWSSVSGPLWRSGRPETSRAELVRVTSWASEESDALGRREGWWHFGAGQRSAQFTLWRGGEGRGGCQSVGPGDFLVGRTQTRAEVMGADRSEDRGAAGGQTDATRSFGGGRWDSEESETAQG